VLVSTGHTITFFSPS